MCKMGLIALFVISIISCSPGLAPNGMSWEEYHAAAYRLKVTHAVADVAGCHELGVVRGMGHHDIGDAKNDAVEKALLLRGNAILFEKLWSDWLPPLRIRWSETFYAEGRVYHCVGGAGSD